jgi:hypothetical protein
MRLFSLLFYFLYIVGYGGNVLLFIYTEYRNWWNLINPFFHLAVLWEMVTHIYFWIFLGITILGYFSSIGAARLTKEVDQ